MTVLLREAIGDRLRRARTAQHRTLREVSRSARVSLGYLSEVERGRKEASSELLAAICDALSLPLPDLLNGVAGDMRPPLFDEREVIDRDRALEGGRLVAAGADRALDAGRLVSAGADGVIEGGRLVPAGAADGTAELLIGRQLQRPLNKNATARATVVAA
jgi:transcriptional regulator with XRE-family HTH domain